MDAKLTGRSGEAAAAEYLKKKKYKIVGTNYSCRFGEIDLIAENDAYVVFAEVKTRRDDSFAAPREYVTAAKQRRIAATAALWLSVNACEKQPRFDVIEVFGTPGAFRSVNHIENAFSL